MCSRAVCAPEHQGSARTSQNAVNRKFNVGEGEFSDVGLIEVVLWLLAQIVLYVMDHRAAGRGAIARRKRKGYPAARRQPR